ncbi:MAG TPA: response regulator [Candidatus Aquilonibacter sp.]|jgi:CheY-like chemotaxis protein|nr:response regulator [Candidatus Aquilonibacter sp.]
MNTPMLDSSLAVLDEVKKIAELKKKRVLLVDASPAKRDLRAEAMRKLGVSVDCAADIAEARSWWRADFYDLVLINVEKGRGYRDSFCEDIRGAKPPQRLAFLVGKPEYLATSPAADDDLPLSYADTQNLIGGVKAALAANLGNINQRWGILEASRRISAVRSACSARSQAMRERPTPPRDFEERVSKRKTMSATLDDLLREELR